MTSGNMRIWDAVEKTDPSHTKKVNQRGGFTAVSAAYQIKSATEQFGPIGVGWGYTSGDPIFEDKFVIIPVTLWHGDRQNTFGPVFGSCEMFGSRPDSDAPKKAGTDALTKLLSQLGFNADVFLGKFDDNKYVAEVSAEYRKADEDQKFDPKDTIERIKSAVVRLESKEEAEVLWKHKATLSALDKLDDSNRAGLVRFYNERLGYLTAEDSV